MAYEMISTAILTHPVHALFGAIVLAQAVRAAFLKIVLAKAQTLRLAHSS